jgi:hypothetical protein
MVPTNLAERRLMDFAMGAVAAMDNDGPRVIVTNVYPVSA